MVQVSHDPMCFGDVEIRPAQRMVLVKGHQAPLGARAIDVLMMLVEYRDRIVTKQELLDQAWAGLVVEENNLQVQISTLRKLLGPQTIATVPGRGYRFTAMSTRSTEPAARPVEVAEPASRGNLPALSPRLMGRDSDIADLVQQVRTHRTVTVVGAGGIGKTQLALAAAYRLRAGFEHEVWLVDLALVTDPALTVSAITQAMSISLPVGKSAGEALASALRGREMLLVLDNCEHLVEAVGLLVQALLDHTALVRVLATSQERLRINDEMLYRIAPLDLPDRATLEDASASSAVALLVQRVQALRADFALDQHNVAAVVDICRRLDGLPLAIELAAARVPLLGVSGVRERLDDRFRVLTAGPRTANRRHQTLREMLDWSCGLLTEAERRVFIHAGVFIGGFALDTAQAVLADDDIDAWAVLDLLGSLVDKSLIVPDATDPPRLRLLETMRAYALERLHQSPADAAPLMRRHAMAMQGLLAAGAEQTWKVPSQQRLARLLPDLDNIRAALAWARRTPEAADIHVLLAGASAWMWLLTDLRVESLGHLEAAIERVGPQTDNEGEAQLLAGWVSLRFPIAGPQERKALARAMELFVRTGNRRGAYDAAWAQITVAAIDQDLRACNQGAQQLEALYDPTWPPIARWQLLAARYMICWCTNSEAVSTVMADTLESLHLAEAFGDLRLRALSLMYLEQATEGLGRFDEAVQRGHELLELLREVPFMLLRPIALANLCLSLTHLGRLDDALDAGRESLAEHRLGGTVVMLLEAAAFLAMKRGRFEASAMALGRSDAAVAHVTGPGARLPNEQRARNLTLEGLELALTASELERLMQAGARLSEDDAASLALDVRG